jgi:hypothetical protein
VATIVGDSESDMEERSIKEERKIVVSRGRVPTRRAAPAKGDKRATLRPVEGKVCFSIFMRWLNRSR